MRVALLDYKHYTWCGEHFLKTCSTPPIKVENEDVIGYLPQHEEIVCIYQNDQGEFYVKAETGSRAGKMWSLPKNVITAGFSLTQNGPVVIYKQSGDKSGSLILA